MTIVFGATFKDPVIHVANLGVSLLDFDSTAGLGPMILLSGNGAGDGNGLFVAAAKIVDEIPASIDLVPHTGIPPVAGSRSAFGSVLIRGTHASLDFDIVTPSGIENATFTLSSVPAAEFNRPCEIGDRLFHSLPTTSLDCAVVSFIRTAAFSLIGAISSTVGM